MPPSSSSQTSMTNALYAQEFRSIQKWLITILEAKGEQFPRNLRKRLMTIYAIPLSDISPSTLQKWELVDPGQKVEDEGVALHVDGNEDEEKKEALRMLGEAMRSQVVIPAVKTNMNIKPRPQTRPHSNSKSRSRRQSIKSLTSSLTTIPDDEDSEAPMKWLSPIISSSAHSGDAILAEEQFFKRSFSAPDLSPMNTRRATGTSLKSRVSAVDTEAQKCANKSPRLSGVFSSIKGFWVSREQNP